ncbi:MAG TPA: ABC transporter ATP-binding protein [Ktedonobacteraceae bacterium]|nr:ABC transporter ATP-binding protein [Ktedonobacteraceae bacterium]
MSQDAQPVIACTGLTKIYNNGVTALDNLTLAIQRGESFGLMGENGAGKSTLVRLLMGFLFPTRGELTVLGENEVRKAHRRIGYLHERPYVELRFTGRRYLTYMAQLSGLWENGCRERVAGVLEQVDLGLAADEKIATYSKGMLQRLMIAQTLLTEPELLILDEPTNGLDPYSQWKMRQIIAALRKQGKTILLCSHYLAEVEMLCDTVGILQRGHLAQYGAVADLVHTTEAVDILLVEGQDGDEIAQRLGLANYIIETDGSLLRIHASAQQVVLAALVEASIPIHTLHPVSSTLEEVYIKSTRPGVEAGMGV